MIEILGQHDGDAVFIDENGPARIPLRVLHAVAHHAQVIDVPDRDPGAAWAGRWFDRDDLAALRRDLDAGALPLLDTCTADGCEDAAPFNLRDARPACATHAKEN